MFASRRLKFSFDEMGRLGRCTAVAGLAERPSLIAVSIDMVIPHTSLRTRLGTGRPTRYLPNLHREVAPLNGEHIAGYSSL